MKSSVWSWLFFLWCPDRGDLAWDWFPFRGRNHWGAVDRFGGWLSAGLCGKANRCAEPEMPVIVGYDRRLPFCPRCLWRVWTYPVRRVYRMMVVWAARKQGLDDDDLWPREAPA